MGFISNIVEFAFTNNIIEADIATKMLGLAPGYHEVIYPGVTVMILDGPQLISESVTGQEVKVVKDMLICIGSLPLKFRLDDIGVEGTALLHFTCNGNTTVFINLNKELLFQYSNHIASAFYNEIEHLDSNVIIADWNDLYNHYMEIKQTGEFRDRLNNRTR